MSLPPPAIPRMHQWPSPGTRLAWKISRKGSIDNLTLGTEQLGPPGPGEVQIAVRAIGLNFADVFTCLGLYSAAPRGEFIPGLEVSGVVTAVGPPAPTASSTPPTEQPADRRAAGTSTTSPSASTSSTGTGTMSSQSQAPGTSGVSLQPGDRVIAVTRFGAFATLINIPGRYVRHIPAGWTFEQAASYPVQALTALYGLRELGALRCGMTVLVHSAAGGVGLQALHILRRYPPVRIMGTVGSANKLPVLQQIMGDGAAAGSTLPVLGAGTSSSTKTSELTIRPSSSSNGAGAAPVAEGLHRFVVRAGPERFRQQVAEYLKEAGARGFDIVFDSLQGDFLLPGYDALSPMGRLVLFGAASLTPRPSTDLSLGWRTWMPPSLLGLIALLWGWLTRPRIDALKLPGDNKAVLGFNLIWLYENFELFDRLYEELSALQLPPPVVGECFHFAELPEGLKHLQSGATIGKVVITLPPPPPSVPISPVP